MDVIGAGIIIEDINGKILVNHRKPFVSEGNKWGVPGGKVVDNRTTLETAIIKTKQEVGIVVSENELTYLDKFNYQAEGNNVIFDIWIYKMNSSEPKIVINTDGHDAYKWEEPKKLFQQKDLMMGMYSILEKYLQLKKISEF